MSVRTAAVWSMASQYVVFLVGFAVSVLISRYFLLPAEVGLFSIGLAAALMVAILQDFGLTRYIAGRPEMSRQEIRTCSSVSFLFALLIAAVVAALAWPMAWGYDEPGLARLMLVIAASYLFVPFSIVPLALATRAMDFRAIFLVNSVGAAVGGGSALALAWAGWGPVALAWGMVAQAAARGAVAQATHPAPIPLRPRLGSAGEVVRFGSLNSVLFVSGAIGSRSSDLIVGRLLGLTAVGLFSRATALSMQLRMLVSGAISGVFYPAFARLRDRGEALGPPYARVVAGYTVVTWPAMAGLALAAEPLVLSLYGPQWAGVAPILTWVALGEMIFVALPLHIELPILLGRMKRLLAFNVVDTVVSITLLAALSLIDVEWAAISRVVYGAAWFALYAPLLSGLVRIDWRALGSTYALSGLATLAAIAPMAVAFRMWPADQPIGLAVLAGLGAGGRRLLAGGGVRRPPSRRGRHPGRRAVGPGAPLAPAASPFGGMSFVYLIAAHDHAHHLSALLDRLLPPGTPDRAVLHLDRRSALWRRERARFAGHASGRVELVESPAAVHWGHRSQLTATRLMLTAALRQPFTLAHHLSGTDWPLVPRARIAAEVAARPDAVWATVLGHAQEERMGRWWLDEARLTRRLPAPLGHRLALALGRAQSAVHRRWPVERSRPLGPWRKGWSWWSVPPHAARAIRDGIAGLEASGRLRGTTCADEHVGPTILSGFGDRLTDYRRYVRWPDGGWSPVFLPAAQAPAALASGAWFARKVDVAADPGWRDSTPPFG